MVDGTATVVLSLIMVVRVYLFTPTTGTTLREEFHNIPPITEKSQPLYYHL